MRHKYNKHCLFLCVHYNIFFLRKRKTKFFTNEATIWLPMFYKKVTFFRIGGIIVRSSKNKRNLNRTIWFECNVASTRCSYIIPVYNNSIRFYD